MGRGDLVQCGRTPCCAKPANAWKEYNAKERLESEGVPYEL